MSHRILSISREQSPEPPPFLMERLATRNTKKKA